MNGLWKNELQPMVIGKCELLSGFVGLDLERGITPLSDDPHGETFPLFELE